MKPEAKKALQILDESFRESGFDITNKIQKALVVGSMITYGRKISKELTQELDELKLELRKYKKVINKLKYNSDNPKHKLL